MSIYGVPLRVRFIGCEWWVNVFWRSWSTPYVTVASYRQGYGGVTVGVGPFVFGVHIPATRTVQRGES